MLKLILKCHVIDQIDSPEKVIRMITINAMIVFKRMLTAWWLNLKHNEFPRMWNVSKRQRCTKSLCAFRLDLITSWMTLWSAIFSLSSFSAIVIVVFSQYISCCLHMSWKSQAITQLNNSNSPKISVKTMGVSAFSTQTYYTKLMSAPSRDWFLFGDVELRGGDAKATVNAAALYARE